MYYDVYEPFVALAAAAAVTTTLEARDGHLPGRAARPDPDREERRDTRPCQRRPVPVRDRRGLEPRGDARPRHRPEDPARADARARARDEGDLDEVEGRVPRPLRRLRPDHDLAEAGPEAAPADPRRRRLPQGRAARARVRRRLDADPRPRRDPREPARAAAHGGRRRPRPRQASRSPIFGMGPNRGRRREGARRRRHARGVRPAAGAGRQGPAASSTATPSSCTVWAERSRLSPNCTARRTGSRRISSGA